VGHYLRQRYGEGIVTEYLDLSVPENRQAYGQVVEAVDKFKLPLPLVAINGEVRLAGGVDYYAISQHLDALDGETKVAAA
jgi:hypothetical protein